MSGPSRLSLAIGSGDLRLPEDARIAVFAPRADTDLSVLPARLCHVITTFKPDTDHFAAMGYTCNRAAEGRYGASVVVLPRERARAQALIAEAAAVTDGPVIVDGAKTDGIEAILKACRQRTEVSPAISKAHGKLFHFRGGPGFEDWAAGVPATIEGGFVTRPGIFSADGIDPASRLLADHLPVKLGRRLADLGAGWGYLGARVLERADIEELHLVEADADALDCARANVLDPRARFHWEDATRWRPEAPLDTVVMNPPFHITRRPDPGLGLAFIRAAAAMLGPKGQLFVVANRHLPYEAEMASHFSEVDAFGGDHRFKLLHGARPARHRR